MLSLLQRFKELLVVGALLLYPFVSFLARGGQPRETNWLDRLLLGVTAPVQHVLTWAVDGVGNGFKGYVALRGVREENGALRAELAKLRREAHLAQEVMRENERLRRLLDYGEQRPGEELPARVIGVNPVLTALSVRIARGEKGGVFRSMPVVTAEGIVGQVVRTTGGFADVALVTDPASKMGVRIQRSRARATAVGGGGGRNLKLENALRTEDIQEGDLVVTSGTDQLYPPGLVVGTVSGLSRKEHGMFMTAEIAPAVDTSKLEEVLVVPTAPGFQGATDVVADGGTP